MRSSTNVYLTALAASDLLYLLFLFSLSLAHYGLSGATADAYWTYWRFGLWLCDATSELLPFLTNGQSGDAPEFALSLMPIPVSWNAHFPILSRWNFLLSMQILLDEL
jgi:hypothetical protein